MVRGRGLNKIPKAQAAPQVEQTPELTEEELQEERRRQAKRDEKAREEERKAAEEARRREERQRADARWEREKQKKQSKEDKEWQAVLHSAREQGVLEAEQWRDGEWYVDLGRSTYKLVQDHYFCPHCGENGLELSWANLESHIKGERHRRSMERREHHDAPFPKAMPVTTPTPSSMPAASSSTSQPVAQHLESWQTRDADGNIMCNLCKKPCDGKHEFSANHLGRLKWHEFQKVNAPFPAPSQPWLAWVPSEWNPDERELRCLLCKGKGVTDLEGKLTSSYKGTHGALSPENQKDHMRKMERLDEYMKDASYWSNILAERRKYHPEPQAAETATRPPALPEAPKVPEGWKAWWSEEYEGFYYHNESTGVTQWETPTESAAPADPAHDFPDIEEC
eukprot:TRINITY_DN7834_c0_g1_i1.p1 TRINITY_DN7834_c0_g1~~TRINITY_DN7834_c0_g1_i1.p1  ORF type:complete len:418 (+),score=111.60 TRINITY_DN7834_c0_g1_i1:72-1256(+)